MLNREIYLKDPARNPLLNEGVARVAQDNSPEARRTLRYELETFVCAGEYERGLGRILTSFLRHLDQTEQPGVWVSGFFGSGKSHLVKMLRALWVDEAFPEDGATARGLAHLPDAIRDDLRELSTAGRRLGGLHAASGTLGAGAGDYVRPALLGVVFRSVGLPEAYAQARFVLWLQREGRLEAVRAAVEAAGRSWEQELNNLYVSSAIAQALLQADPGFADSPAAARQQLREQFPNREDISHEQMVEAVREALTRDGRFPLTLIVLDEVQQYIGDVQDRTHQIQEAVEACSKSFGSRLMFAGTGQTALAGTPSLQRLMGRFTVKVELSDTDVDTVVRRIILAKKPDAVPAIQQMVGDHQGEISRHLLGTGIGYRPEDLEVLVADYPMLPVRRRFWERCLRSVDPTGTRAQLRNQLRVVHEAACRSADAELGCVVPADFLFDQIASDLLQTGSLSREVYERVRALQAGDADSQLQARLCALVFLIGKLPREGGADLKVRATETVLADLLVEDLRQGSDRLRQRLPALLEQLVETGLLMRVEDEYRLQTREGSAWNEEYRRQLAAIQNNPQQLESARVERFRQAAREQLGALSLRQGRCKEPRKAELHFGEEAPPDPEQRLYLWVRDGWATDEGTVLADARRAGSDAATLFVFLPRRQAGDIRAELAALLAAEATLHARGMPSTPEGQEARNAMLTRQQAAQRRLASLLEAAFGDACVYQGGGQEVAGGSLREKIGAGLNSSLARLYPRFDEADHDGWANVIARAKKGDGEALAAVGHAGNAEEHPVCKAVLEFVGAGKTGSEIRERFSGSPFGWPRDAIDGALFVLLATDHLRAADASRQPVGVGQLTQALVTKTSFRVETVILSAQQKLKVRKLLQELGLPTKPGEELQAAPQAVAALRQLAETAGGEPPRPEQPSTTHLEELASLHGNELLVALAERQQDLLRDIQTWKGAAEAIGQRMRRWETLLRLLGHARGLAGTEAIEQSVHAVRDGRQLLAEPDPVPPLCTELGQILRAALLQARGDYEQVYGRETASLQADPTWNRLSAEQREQILREQGISATPPIRTGTEDEILASLDEQPLATWRDRTAALPERFQRALLQAIQMLTPAARRIPLPSRTLRTPEEAQAWLEEVRALIEERLAEGPVVV